MDLFIQDSTEMGIIEIQGRPHFNSNVQYFVTPQFLLPGQSAPCSYCWLSTSFPISKSPVFRDENIKKIKHKKIDRAWFKKQKYENPKFKMQTFYLGNFTGDVEK